MKYSSTNRGIPAGNPIANALVVIVGAFVIGASIVLGFVAFVVLGSIVLILGSIIGLRVWWFNRKLRRQAGAQPALHACVCVPARLCSCVAVPAAVPFHVAPQRARAYRRDAPPRA